MIHTLSSVVVPGGRWPQPPPPQLWTMVTKWGPTAKKQDRNFIEQGSRGCSWPWAPQSLKVSDYVRKYGQFFRFQKGKKFLSIDIEKKTIRNYHIIHTVVTKKQRCREGAGVAICPRASA